MTNEVTSLVVIAVMLGLVFVIGMVPGMKNKLNLEEWAVGGRSFGRWLNWFVLAGEIYTAFAFLGASGWAYAKGGPIFYILGYGGLAYVVMSEYISATWHGQRRACGCSRCDSEV